MDLGFCYGGACNKEESALALVIVTTTGKVHSPKRHTEAMIQGELITLLLSADETASVLCCPAHATPLHPWPDQEGGGEMTKESWQGNKNGQGPGAHKRQGEEERAGLD